MDTEIDLEPIITRELSNIPHPLQSKEYLQEQVKQLPVHIRPLSTQVAGHFNGNVQA